MLIGKHSDCWLLRSMRPRVVDYTSLGMKRGAVSLARESRALMRIVDHPPTVSVDSAGAMPSACSR